MTYLICSDYVHIDSIVVHFVYNYVHKHNIRPKVSIGTCIVAYCVLCVHRHNHVKNSH